MRDIFPRRLGGHVIIAEITVQTPVLESTLAAHPDVTIEVERERSVGSEETVQLLFWAHGDDHDGFEAAMADDSSIAEFEHLAEDDGRRLYRANYSEAVSAASSNQVWVDLGGVLLDAVGTRDGWEARFRFPDRDAFASFADWWQDNYDTLSVDALYSSADDSGGMELTELQHETLRRALEAGYFDVPRRTTLEELAEEFDISAQALSVRLRKGTAALVENSVTEDTI